jgi:hypothetical protein
MTKPKKSKSKSQKNIKAIKQVRPTKASAQETIDDISLSDEDRVFAHFEEYKKIKAMMDAENAAYRSDQERLFRNLRAMHLKPIGIVPRRRIRPG